ncbi:hypothetical protein C8Q80DRAFT_1273083 [Daedaleopsis nitida]|nr:hypothetical protein C8Q80DRAFT_1273083 [Daedaleopsis nitida]
MSKTLQKNAGISCATKPVLAGSLLFLRMHTPRQQVPDSEARRILDRLLKDYYTTDYDSFAKHRPPYGPPLDNELAMSVFTLALLTGETNALPYVLLMCSMLGPDIVKGCAHARRRLA